MELESLSTLLALTLGAGWASSINLYAAVLALGLAGATGYADLPAGLELVENPFVIAAAGVPWLNSLPTKYRALIRLGTRCTGLSACQQAPY